VDLLELAILSHWAPQKQ